MKKVMMEVSTYLEPYRSESVSVVLGYFSDEEAEKVQNLLREKYETPLSPAPDGETWEQQLHSQRDRLERMYPDGCIRSFWVADARIGDPTYTTKGETGVEAALEKAAYKDYCRDAYHERWSFVSS
jgi:hypothetical protein